MKNLSRIHLHDDALLSDKEMKQVLGGSGADGMGDSGADGSGGKKVTFDCLCYEIDPSKANESGVLPPPDKRVFVTATSVREAVSLASASCSEYLNVTCS